MGDEKIIRVWGKEIFERKGNVCKIRFILWADLNFNDGSNGELQQMKCKEIFM